MNVNDADFLNRRTKALEQLREMSRRSADENRNQSTTKYQDRTDSKSGKATESHNKVLESSIGIDSDTALIMGLLLILLNEKTDNTLLLALLYILL